MTDPTSFNDALTQPQGRWAPEYAERIAAVRDQRFDMFAPTREDIAEMEAFGLPFGEPEPTAARVTDATVAGPHGPIGVRVYEPIDSHRPSAAVLWMHGGGFVGGDLDMPEADSVARGLVTRTGAVVVSVDYRLCVGGIHHPIPHDDCWAAYTWLRERAGEWGIDASRVVVGGASAGANLAASLALRGRDEQAPPAEALLMYPILHPYLPEPDAELADCLAQVPAPLLFPTEVTTALNENYLGGPIDTADALAYPGIAEDLADFPPVYLEASEFDQLRSSGAAFAEALRAAGSPVTYVVAAGVPHGHLNAIGSRYASASLDRMASRIAAVGAES